MFTYNAAAPTSDLDRVRLHIGDTVEGEGPRVGGRNFSDAELGVFLTQGGAWAQAVLLALLALANEWSTAAYSVKTGQFSGDYTAQADALCKQAAFWASTHPADGAVSLGGLVAGSVALDWWETTA